MPPKIWRPKVLSKYTVPEYSDIDVDNILDYSQFGNCVYRPLLTWDNNNDRDDIIIFDDTQHSTEITNDLKLHESLDDNTRAAITRIVKEYWDCFAKSGAKRTILGYEFGIDTGGATPVCCRQPSYGPYESRIIMKQVEQLLHNEWIEECGGPWGSMIVLAQKPHQEHITDINEFVWRMCVSYRKLNSVTKPFQFPIPRCDDAINILGYGAGKIWIISLDARQGYHQVSVRAIDREKLAFFAPNNKKYCFNVMPFGPTNAPSFYTAMMKNLKDEWDNLFIIRMKAMETFQNKDVFVTAAKEIMIGREKLISGSKVIIDDILLWCTNKELILTYLECVCAVFKKYRVSFRLDKCDFLKPRIEYVGHDILADGNCPASSKFKLIDDWPLPNSGQSLFSFVGLVNFYHRYAPYMELRLKPLRKLVKKFYRKPIPENAWTEELKSLFSDLKQCITSSPVLARFDPNKPTFLKTDWSSEGMAYILMQPSDDAESQKAMKLLEKSGICKFELSKDGARLKPVSFGSRSCNDNERYLHSFTGEVACGRWAISQNRKYLWGCHFYWLCDCSAVKEVLEYDGTIPMICRWAQELLGYQFTCIHRNAKMMTDVDALSRRFGPLIATHCLVAQILHGRSKSAMPLAYVKSAFHHCTSAKISTSDISFSDIPILTSSFIASSTCDLTIPAPVNSDLIISTSPILYISSHRHDKVHKTASANKSEIRILQDLDPLFSNWLCINDISGSLCYWAQRHSLLSRRWHFKYMFTAAYHATLFQILHPDQRSAIDTLTSVQSSVVSSKASIISITYIKDGIGNIYDWFNSISVIFGSATHKMEVFRIGMIWIHDSYFISDIANKCINILQSQLASDWVVSYSSFNAADYGDTIDSNRIMISILPCWAPTSLQLIPKTPKVNDFTSGFTNGLVSTTTLRSVTMNFNVPHTSIVEHTNNRAQILSIFHSRTLNDFEAFSASNYILDPGYPGLEPAPAAYSNNIFGRRFGVPVDNVDGFTTRHLENTELLHCYSIPTHQFHNSSLDNECYTEWLDDVIHYCIPIELFASVTSNLITIAGFEDDLVYGKSEHSDTHQCYQITASPTTIDWTDAYSADSSTAIMLEQFNRDKKPTWTDELLQKVKKEYHTFLKQNLIGILHRKLVLYKPIFRHKRYVTLIIVPETLRRKIFSHYHAGPSGGHMGEYKTLFRIRMRFYWPGIRKNVKDWVKCCAHCCAYNIWRNRKSELYFSWPVTTPFYIMHVDLWMPGHLTDDNNNTVQCMNAMCDLTQFVVSTLVDDATSENLARLFMENVVLSFGMVAVVVVDADSKFLNDFKTMCDVLKITFWPLSRGNHKGNSVERYHRFLNKTQTIVGQDRGTHHTFLQNMKTSQYAWNSAPIDDTDIPRSLAAVGRHFAFPMDIDLHQLPSLNCDNNSALFKYLRDVSNDSTFAISILQVLIEERRSAHRLRWNKDRDVNQFHVGDVVKAHVQVQSNSEKGDVKKLSYQARGPFRIIKVLDANSYIVQRYNDPSSASRKYKGTELYLLPPSLFPHEPLDTMDERYLNSSFAPVVSPLKKPFQISLYDDIYFPSSSHIIKQPFLDQPSCGIDKPSLASHVQPTFSPTANELFQENGINMPPIEHSDSTDFTSIEAPTDLDNKLFFIQYTPEDTLRRRWYLVQIDMESTATANPDYATNGKYWCIFHYSHPNDKDKSDEFSRWWPEWYRYTRCSTTDAIIYEYRILIRPSVTPCSKKFIQWAALIPLYGTKSTVLVGPFDFASITMSNRVRQRVSREYWDQLSQICNNIGILPPTVGVLQNSYQQSNQSTKKKRKRSG